VCGDHSSALVALGECLTHLNGLVAETGKATLQLEASRILGLTSECCRHGHDYHSAMVAAERRVDVLYGVVAESQVPSSRELLVDSLLRVAMLHWGLGDLSAARVRLEEAAALEAKSGQESGETYPSKTRQSLLKCCEAQGEVDVALALRQEEVSWLRTRTATEKSAVYPLKTALKELARAHRKRGDLRAAVGAYSEALSLSEGDDGIRTSYRIAMCHDLLHVQPDARGRDEEAETTVPASSQERYALAWEVAGLAVACRESGDLDTAARWLARAVTWLTVSEEDTELDHYGASHEAFRLVVAAEIREQMAELEFMRGQHSLGARERSLSVSLRERLREIYDQEVRDEQLKAERFAAAVEEASRAGDARMAGSFESRVARAQIRMREVKNATFPGKADFYRNFDVTIRDYCRWFAGFGTIADEPPADSTLPAVLRGSGDSFGPWPHDWSC